MVNKFHIAMFLAAIAIALVAGSMVEITDSTIASGGITVEKKHSMLFETSISTYPAFLNITLSNGNETDVIGFDTSPNEIDFGSIPSGGSISRKFVYISNPTSSKARITITKTGSLAQMINISENNFILMPGEGKNISLAAGSDNNEPGLYSAEISISFRKPSSVFLDFAV